MSLYPEQTCLLCDLPWKNNRVRYDGRLALESMPRKLVLGRMELALDAEGRIAVGKEVIPTGYSANNATIALDTLHDLLYFASDKRMIAFDLAKKTPEFTVETQGVPGAPLLFEWLMPDGEICEALGFSDGQEHYIVLDRVTGTPLWCAPLIEEPADAAAHWNGYLYLTMQGDPCAVMCLEADTGQVVWWNRGTLPAKGGVICEGRYCVLYENGTWQRFSIVDGEKLP